MLWQTYNTLEFNTPTLAHKPLLLYFPIKNAPMITGHFLDTSPLHAKRLYYIQNTVISVAVAGDISVTALYLSPLQIQR